MDYKKMWEDLKKSIDRSKNDFETSESDKELYECVEFKMKEIEERKSSF